MLNMHPAFSLAGENNKQLDDVFELWMKAAYQKWRSAPWQRAAPNPASLLCLLQEWFIEISGAPNKRIAQGEQSAPLFIRGFKEIRWQATAQRLRHSQAFGANVDLPPLPPANVSMLHFTSLLFPCSRFIFNTRETPSAFRRRVGLRRYGPSHLAALSQLHAAWGPQGRSFWLPLENFSVTGFNSLLRWLGEDGCQYHQLLHDNEDGDMNAQPPSVGLRKRVLPDSELTRCTLLGGLRPASTIAKRPSSSRGGGAGASTSTVGGSGGGTTALHDDSDTESTTSKPSKAVAGQDTLSAKAAAAAAARAARKALRRKKAKSEHKNKKGGQQRASKTKDGGDDAGEQ